MSGRFLRGRLRRDRAWLGLLQRHHAWIGPADVRMMHRALELARAAAAGGEVPVGAVVYREGEVIAEAANDREATRDPAGHAELVALRRAGERLGGLVFAAHDPKAGAVGTLYDIPRDARLNHRLPCAGGLLAPEAVGLLRNFFQARRRAHS